MEFPDIVDLGLGVTEFLVQEQNFFLQYFILARRWQLVDSS